MVQRLPSDSLTAALVAGKRHLFGWSPERHQLADIFDAININTRATGMWKGSPPEFPLAQRPSDEGETTETAKPAVSVADLYRQFSRR